MLPSRPRTARAGRPAGDGERERERYVHSQHDSISASSLDMLGPPWCAPSCEDPAVQSAHESESCSGIFMPTCDAVWIRHLRHTRCIRVYLTFFCRLVATPSGEFHQVFIILWKETQVFFFSAALGDAKSLSPSFLSVASPLQFFAATAALAFFVPMHKPQYPNIMPVSCLLSRVTGSLMRTTMTMKHWMWSGLVDTRCRPWLAHLCAWWWIVKSTRQACRNFAVCHQDGGKRSFQFLSFLLGGPAGAGQPHISPKLPGQQRLKLERGWDGGHRSWCKDVWGFIHVIYIRIYGFIHVFDLPCISLSYNDILKKHSEPNGQWPVIAYCWMARRQRGCDNWAGKENGVRSKARLRRVDGIDSVDGCQSDRGVSIHWTAHR